MSSRFYPLVGWLFLLGFASLTGCKTADEAHFGHMASVTISGHTRTEILQATATILKADGYHETDELTFDKPGSAWETANYGGWSSDAVGVRIRFALVSVELGQHKLGCDACIVQGYGQPGMEVEQSYWFAKRTECKKILDAIKASLASAPAGTNARSSP
jgi:hypothetical protein